MKDIAQAVAVAEAARRQGKISGWTLMVRGVKFTACADLAPFRMDGPLNSFVQREDPADALERAVLEAMELARQRDKVPA
jgi:hypothetical protein